MPLTPTRSRKPDVSQNPFQGFDFDDYLKGDRAKKMGSEDEVLSVLGDHFDIFANNDILEKRMDDDTMFYSELDLSDTATSFQTPFLYMKSLKIEDEDPAHIEKNTEASGNADGIGNIGLFISEASPELTMLEEIAMDESTPALASCEMHPSSRLVDRIRRRRQVPSGTEYLTQWKGKPCEKDWTWLSEAAMKKYAPAVLKEWLSDEELQKAEAVDLSYQPERIISRRKVKGIPHYLVKWKGYESIKDRTWEPCERLKVDAFFLVDAYENRNKK